MTPRRDQVYWLQNTGRAISHSVKLSWHFLNGRFASLAESTTSVQQPRFLQNHFMLKMSELQPNHTRQNFTCQNPDVHSWPGKHRSQRQMPLPVAVTWPVYAPQSTSDSVALTRITTLQPWANVFAHSKVPLQTVLIASNSALDSGCTDVQLANANAPAATNSSAADPAAQHQPAELLNWSLQQHSVGQQLPNSSMEPLPLAAAAAMPTSTVMVSTSLFTVSSQVHAPTTMADPATAVAICGPVAPAILKLSITSQPTTTITVARWSAVHPLPARNLCPVSTQPTAVADSSPMLLPPLSSPCRDAVITTAMAVWTPLRFNILEGFCPLTDVATAVALPAFSTANRAYSLPDESPVALFPTAPFAPSHGFRSWSRSNLSTAVARLEPTLVFGSPHTPSNAPTTFLCVNLNSDPAFFWCTAPVRAHKMVKLAAPAAQTAFACASLPAGNSTGSKIRAAFTDVCQASSGSALGIKSVLNSTATTISETKTGRLPQSTPLTLLITGMPLSCP